MLHFTLDTYLILLSVKQGSIKYHFLSLWYDTARNWTQVSRTIGEHSTHESMSRYKDNKGTWTKPNSDRSKKKKKLCMNLIIPATSTSSEEWLSNLILISVNKNFLMKMKIEREADTFYNKVIDEFAKKKQKNELKAQYQLARIYLKEQAEYIQNQIDKIRDSVEDRQSRIAWQTINEISRRASTAKAKLKAASQQERVKLWEQHFKNLLGSPPKITDEPITRIISKQLDITICRLYQGLRFHPQREDGTNPTSIRPTKRNRSSNNDSLQKDKSESTFTRWRHGILRYCCRSTTRRHASLIPLYHLSRLRA